MNFKREIPILALVIAPLIYLMYMWNELPNKVPMHWNIKGEIDRWGSKNELFIIVALPLFIYLILLVVPAIDPKRKIQLMGDKFHALKLILVAFMSALAMYIIYATKTQSLGNANMILVFIGLLFLVFGNYMKTIKSNYFIGIRTPWTLENEEVWKKTHKLAGKLWFVGGFLMVIISLLLKQKESFFVFFIITIIITLIPVVYSYLYFKRLENE